MKLLSNIFVFICSLLIVLTFCSCSDDSNYNDFDYSSGTTVYVTRTGEKYHRSSCRHLNKSKIEIDLEEAQSKGYDRCAVCKP